MFPDLADDTYVDDWFVRSGVLRIAVSAHVTMPIVEDATHSKFSIALNFAEYTWRDEPDEHHFYGASWYVLNTAANGLLMQTAASL